MLTVQLAESVVGEDQLSRLFEVARAGANSCKLWTTDGKEVVIYIERTDGKVVRMTIGEKEVDRGFLAQALFCSLGSELDVVENDTSRLISKQLVLEGIAAGFGVIIDHGP